MAETLRWAFIRVHAENDTKDNGLVRYSFDDINEKVRSFADRYSGTKFAWILHDRDFDKVTNAPTPLHFHIVLLFKAPVKFKYIKEAFPYGNIQNGISKNAAIQYLLHINDSDKSQYDRSRITTNLNDSALDEYLTSTDGATNSRTMVDNLLKRIASGEIREYNRFKYIDPVTLARNQSLFTNAFKNRSEEIMSDYNREISVIFIYGAPGTGKTTYAKTIAKAFGNGSIYVSSSSNDTMQDYKGQDVLILDDLRDDAFSFADFLKVIDNHTATSIKSRFFNKTFIGKAIIITSCVPYDQWYSDTQENRNQLYRRISAYLVMTKESLETYELEYDSANDSYSPRFDCSVPNPVLAMFEAESRNKNDTIGAILQFTQAMSNDVKLSDEFRIRLNEALSKRALQKEAAEVSDLDPLELPFD